MRVGIDFRGAQCSGSGLRGIGRYTVDLINGLRTHAPEIEVVLFSKHNVDLPSELSPCEVIKVPAMSWTDPTDALWTKIPKIRSSDFLHGRRCRQAVAEQKVAMELALAQNPVDLLHVPSALDIGSYPIFDCPVPLVATFLDAIVLKLKANTFDRFRPFQQKYYLEQAKHLQRADRIVAISNASAADAISEFQLDAARIDVVYPAVSKMYSQPMERPATAGSLPYFLFCSVPDPHKNPMVVLEAFRDMPDGYQLIFVSPKEAELMPQIMNFAQASGFSDRFTVTGYVPEHEMYGLFQHATAVVSPSQMEGFGLPVAQAMRAGTPVITSRESAQGEIADGVGYLVDPNSALEVKEAMVRVIADNRDGKRLALGQERAHQFDSEVVTGQLVEVYKKTLETRRNFV